MKSGRRERSGRFRNMINTLNIELYFAEQKYRILKKSNNTSYNKREEQKKLLQSIQIFEFGCFQKCRREGCSE